MHRHLQTSGRRLDEQLRGAHPLLEREQEPLPGRAEGEQPVHPAGSEEVDVRRDSRLVERLPRILQRRQGSRECALQHAANSKLNPVGGLRIDRDGEVLHVTLARPERRNAFDAELIGALTEAFGAVGDARVVVLAGEGQSFCAGADIEWQRSAIDLTFEANVEDAHRLYKMCETIDRCPAPVVARVQGHALGGGSGLAACADIAIAAPDAVFGFSEVKLGIIPAVISPFVLPKIGQHARRYFLTGERFDAQTALRIGLVHEIAEDLDDAVDRAVAELLSSGAKAVREAKQLIREAPTGEETAEIAARLRTSEEGQERLRAFFERRS
jgi:methylglutaconyl-CoA hydratase